MKIEGSGRKKGTPNKKTQTAMELAEKVGVDPLEILLMFAKGDWEGLGYDAKYNVKKDQYTGEEVFTDKITPDVRMNAAKEASKYIYPQRKALEGSLEGNALKIVIEDYVSKK